MDNKKMDKMIYLMVLQTYLEKNNCPNSEEAIRKLFPEKWGLIEDYHLKSDILNEAINNNVKVEETQGYINYKK